MNKGPIVWEKIPLSACAAQPGEASSQVTCSLLGLDKEASVARCAIAVAIAVEEDEWKEL